MTTADAALAAALEEIVRDATALIRSPSGSGPMGAGFFIDRDLVLTARHVVSGEKVIVQPHGAGDLSGAVLPTPAGAGDLDVALVRVTLGPDDVAPPAVLLHRRIETGTYRAFGYPTDDWYAGEWPALEARTFDGERAADNDTKQVRRLRLGGNQLKEGFSGGAVLSPSGTVVALVDYSSDPSSALGGAAIPIASAALHFEEIRSALARPPYDATQRWRQVLGRARWEALQLVWEPDRLLDVYLSGNRRGWSVGLLPEAPGCEARRVSDLGDEMAEVLVRWARSSGRRNQGEVQLLGRLLSAAIMPDEVSKHVPRPAEPGSDPVLVRLHVDVDSELAELPWEFATIPGTGKEFLAAHEGYALTRVDHAPNADPADAGGSYEPAGVASVLPIVVQPPLAEPFLPQVLLNSTLVPWNTAASVAENLRASITKGAKLSVTDLLVNPQRDEFEATTSGGTPHAIVHYVGYGFIDQHGDPMICLAGGDQNYQEVAAESVLRSIARCRPALVVLQFGLPPVHRGDDPIGPEVLKAARGLGIPAIVSSRPVHWSQYEPFNQVMYDQLRAGATVEDAVQRARRTLQLNHPVDHAAFGWFTLSTSGPSRRRLFAPPPKPSSVGQPAGVPLATPDETPPPLTMPLMPVPVDELAHS